jgi:hypothetical protein
MSFNTHSKRKCVRALRTLTPQFPYLIAVVEKYAILRGWNAEVFCGVLLMRRGFKNIRTKYKHKLKTAMGIM